MTRWTWLDYAVAVAPFLILGGIGWWTVHHGQRRCLCCGRSFRTVAARRLHERFGG